VVVEEDCGAAAVEEGPPAREGFPAVGADDEVGEDFDAEDGARLPEAAGDAFVVAGGFGVVGGVVVGDDDGTGAVDE
jgi:hypothetical protein